MAATQQLSHVAMSVPPGTLTDGWREQVLGFYGELFGWKEMDELRLPDRLTIAVGSSYINVRERADAPAYNGYEHFGVVFSSSEELRAIWDNANRHASSEHEADITLEPLNESPDGYLSFRLRYLLPLTIEAQFFPKRGA
jgi:hypothetical protein